MSGVGFRDKWQRGDREALPKDAAVRERQEMFTSLQGEVVDFDEEKQEATIKILHKPQINGEEKKFPELKKVPVKFNRGGGGDGSSSGGSGGSSGGSGSSGSSGVGSAMTWPIKKGDPGEVSFASRDISKWYKEGDEQTADTGRNHDLSDAVFIPGAMRSEKQAVKKFNKDEAEWRSLKEDGYPKIRQHAEKKHWNIEADAETTISMVPGEVTIKAKKIVLEAGGSKITIENDITIKPAGKLLEG